MNTFSWVADASFSTRLTMALLHFLWQGCCGGMLVIVSGALLRGGSARLRYAMNVAALLLMACCLPVTFSVLDIPDAGGDKAALQNVNEPGAAGSALDENQAPSTRQIVPPASALPESTELAGQSVATTQAGRTPTNSSISPEAPRPAFRSALTANAFQSLSRWVATLYLFGVVLILGRLLRGVWGGNRLRKLASVINDESLLETVGKLCRRLGLKVAPTVAWCEQISIPVVVGVLKPMILLPTAVVTGLTTNQLQALMLHELAHIRRFDPIVNLFQRIIEAVLFFHPVVWFVSRRISIEREKAADDMVLASGWDRPAYADALIRMAELSSSFSRSGVARHAAVLGASGSRPTEFKLRVLRLLDDSHQPELQMSRAGMLTMVVVVTFAGIFAWSRTDNNNSTPHRSNAAEARDSEPDLAIDNQPPIADRHANRTVAKVAEKGPPAKGASQDAAKNVVQAANDQDEAAAAKELVKLQGRLIRDETLPGRPVKRILFRATTLFGDQHVHLLKSFPHLTELHLNWTLCTDVGMKEVGELTMLKKLMLTNNRDITDASLKQVGKLKDLTTLTLAGCKKITDVGVKEIAGLKNLTTLFLSNTAVTDACLKDLRGLRHLKYLGLDRTKVTNAGIKGLQESLPDAQITGGTLRSKPLPMTAPKAEEAADEPTATARIKPLGGLVTIDGALPHPPVTAVTFGPESQFNDNDVPVFKSFKHLTKLNLSGTLITDAGIKELGSLKALTELTLDRTAITDVGLKGLTGLTNLKMLRLQSCRKITDAGLKELGTLKDLVELNLDSCEEITDAGARGLASLKNLQKINVGNTEIGDAGVKELCRLENLNSINLGGNPALSRGITDASARDIGRLHNLTSLALWSKRVTDEGVKELGQLKNLKSLNLQMTQVSEAGAKELSRLKNLTSLTVVGPQITDAAVKELSRLENLKYLLVAGDQITDVGVKELRQLKSLTNLVVGSPRVTDVGAKELGELKSLKSLDLTSCSQVTAAAIAELRKALPDAQIPSRQNRSQRQRK